MSVLKKIKGVQSRLIYEILFGSILLMFSIWGLSIYFHVGDTVYTDDAQVEENVNPVNARIPGYIREVRFNEHETVRAGDTIIIIDDKEYKIALQKAIASLEAAKANNAVAQSDLGVAHVGISISEANLAEIKTRLDNQETNLKRYANLLAEDVVSQYQYDQVKTEFEALKAKYKSLFNQRKSTQLNTNASTNKINETEANIVMAKAAVDQALLNLSYCYIVMPYTGVMGRKKIVIGQLISAGQTLVTIVQSGTKWVTANYTESQIARIKLGQNVKLKVDALPGYTFSGKVVAISGATGSRYSSFPVDNSTGNFVKVQQRIPVRIEFTRSNDSLKLAQIKAGMNVEVDE